jgi:soluble lytic murein transglycosylase-like protein
LALIVTAVFFTVRHNNAVREQQAIEAQQQALAIAKEKYTFTIGDKTIEATSADEALAKTKALLQDQVEKNKDQEDTIIAMQAKYDQKIDQSKAITAKDVNLYNEFSYAINYPGSDMTLNDIKMIVDISKQENVNPHVWLSLVELESKFQSYSRSNRSTAAGWGQVLKGTGKSLYEDELKLGNYNHATMGINKEINARMSIHYLGDLIKETGSVEKALISYNGGELGAKYASIVNQNLKENAGITLSSAKAKNPI